MLNPSRFTSSSPSVAPEGDSMNGPAAESSVTRSALPAMMRGPPSSRPVSGEFSSMWRGFDTREVLRLILQTLDEMGYRSACKT